MYILIWTNCIILLDYSLKENLLIFFPFEACENFIKTVPLIYLHHAYDQRKTTPAY